MPKKQSIKRHALIIDRLKMAPRSFKDLNSYLKSVSADGEDYTLSLRTFQREKTEIAELYGIEIAYSRAERGYTITAEPEQAHGSRYIETFNILNSLTDDAAKYIILEKRRPLGTEHMHGLLHAIKNRLEVHFTHHKFWEDAAQKTYRTVQPLALKEARSRWYLIAVNNKDGLIKTFGLDRISQLEVTNTTFLQPSNYDAEKAFKHSFGIINDNRPQKIILSFTAEQGRYVKSLPLHHSQKEIVSTDSEYRIELYMQPTYDFEMELLSLGNKVKVLEPDILRHEIKNRLQQALALY